jgi:hypothetical protein
VEQADQKADKPAKTVPDESYAFESQGIEQIADIGRDSLLFVAIGRCLRPPAASKVGTDNPMAHGERRDHVAPGPPVLKGGVEQQDGFTLTGCGHMHSQIARLDELVTSAREKRQRRRYFGRRFDRGSPYPPL